MWLRQSEHLVLPAAVSPRQRPLSAGGLSFAGDMTDHVKTEGFKRRSQHPEDLLAPLFGRCPPRERKRITKALERLYAADRPIWRGSVRGRPSPLAESRVLAAAAGRSRLRLGGRAGGPR